LAAVSARTCFDGLNLYVVVRGSCTDVEGIRDSGDVARGTIRATPASPRVMADRHPHSVRFDYELALLRSLEGERPRRWAQLPGPSYTTSRSSPRARLNWARIYRLRRTRLEITAVGLDEFVKRIREGKPENTAIRAAESTLTAIMATMAIDRKREVTWAELV
jgi:hypothetical protein